MDSSFGARLRAQRERQEIALDAISKDTKIKLSILEGLERDDVSQWPEGIYRRAYVRAYARAIGLEPEALVREFLEVHPEPVVSPPVRRTELENPDWPAGFRRFITSAKAVVPPRREQVEDLPADPPAPRIEAKPVPVPAPRAPAPQEREPELMLAAAAELCTRLGRVRDKREVGPILEDAAIALDAVGLIVWSWDAREAALRPSLTHGYSDTMLNRMNWVKSDAENAIATSFRSARTCVVDGDASSTGAVVVPLMGHAGCVGVLAIELPHGDERRECVHAFATILAAQLVTLVGSAALAKTVNA